MSSGFLARAAAPAALLLPCAFIFGAYFVWPQMKLLALSLWDGGPSLAHYARFLGDGYYLSILVRTLLLGFAVAAITLVLGYPLAYLLARGRSRLIPFLLVVATFPLWVSAVVRAFGWMVLLLENGLVSDTLLALGLTNGPVQLLYTFTGVVIAVSQVLLPIMVLTLYGVIRTIDPDLELAARNLGASPLAAAWLVTVRLSRNGILAGTLLVFALSVSTFASPSLVGGPRARVMALLIYEQALELMDWSFAATAAVVLLAVSLAIVAVYAKLVGSADGR